MTIAEIATIIALYSNSPSQSLDPFSYYSAMPRRIFRNLFGLFLSAMMLVTSIMPPGIRHAHAAGGDFSHGHSNDVNPVTGNECQENSHPTQDTNFDGSTVENSLGADRTHRHFQFFGVTVTLPDTHRSPEKSGEDTPKNQLVSIRATEDILPVTQSNSDARTLLVPFSDDYSPHAVVMISAIPHSFQPVAPTLLCDRARHERSGVQLI